MEVYAELMVDRTDSCAGVSRRERCTGDHATAAGKHGRRAVPLSL
jgi:hypothetical protein